jgi:hypothetical protein
VERPSFSIDRIRRGESAVLRLFLH